MTPLTVAVAGLGTVGAAVVKLLKDRADLLTRRCGRPIDVIAVSARDRSRDRGVDLSGLAWYDDAATMATEAGADVVVELIGGSGGIARRVCESAIDSRRDVVSANKALLAEHGEGLARRAEAAGVSLAFEGAVAGGIPAVKGVREGLAANRLDMVLGILNGTCNYILTEMEDTGREFADVLLEAQSMGYAEADPSLDIDGFDTAHKLTLLASLAFNGTVAFEDVHIEGIRSVQAQDIRYAGELGYRIKLVGLAARNDGEIELRVHPCLIDRHEPLASVWGVYNAVVAHGDSIGQVMMTGRGAGAGPTASAVVGDLVDIARGCRVPTLGARADRLERLVSRPMDRRYGAYYLRLMVVDRPGVIADIAAAMRDQKISVETLLQRGRSEVDAVPVVITTHETTEAAMRRAVADIAALDAVLEPPMLIRIETLAE